MTQEQTEIAAGWELDALVHRALGRGCFPRGHGEQTQFYRSDAPTQTIPPYTADAGEADRALAERCRQLAEVAAFPHDFTVAMNPQRRPEDRYYVAIHGLGTTYDGYGSTLGEAAGRAIRATAPGLTLAPTDRR